jgi:hypothetical protein
MNGAAYLTNFGTQFDTYYVKLQELVNTGTIVMPGS